MKPKILLLILALLLLWRKEIDWQENDWLQRQGHLNFFQKAVNSCVTLPSPKAEACLDKLAKIWGL